MQEVDSRVSGIRIDVGQENRVGSQAEGHNDHVSVINDIAPISGA
jgi:hypothetical protein